MYQVWGAPGFSIRTAFFLFYINDLPNASQLTEVLLFADDTGIFYSHSDVNHLTAVVDKELQNINTWMKANKLSVNVKKTNYVIFKSKQRRIGTNTSLSPDGFVIIQQKFVNFLGVLIDKNVSWKCHINDICKKMSKSIGIISRASFYLFILVLFFSLPLFNLL